jgi:hypothetical protein
MNIEKTSGRVYLFISADLLQKQLQSATHYHRTLLGFLLSLGVASLNVALLWFGTTKYRYVLSSVATSLSSQQLLIEPYVEFWSIQWYIAGHYVSCCGHAT